MKHCKVLIKPIAESKEKKKGMKTDNKVVYVEREEERHPGVEMIVRRCTKEVNKLMMRCFYQSDPTRRGYQQMIAIRRDIATFEVAQQRLVDQATVRKTNGCLIEVELEEIGENI